MIQHLNFSQKSLFPEPQPSPGHRRWPLTSYTAMYVCTFGNPGVRARWLYSREVGGQTMMMMYVEAKKNEVCLHVGYIYETNLREK